MSAAALARAAAARTLVVETVACGNFPHAHAVGLPAPQDADGTAPVKASDLHWQALSKPRSKVRTPEFSSKRRARLMSRQVTLASCGP